MNRDASPTVRSAPRDAAVRYRKKPVVIEAMQWTGDNFAALDKWMGDGGDLTHRTFPADGRVEIDTLEGVMTASLNDWIIRGVSGEHYPCKPGIFEMTYELADPLDSTEQGEGTQ